MGERHGTIPPQCWFGNSHILPSGNCAIYFHAGGKRPTQQFGSQNLPPSVFEPHPEWLKRGCQNDIYGCVFFEGAPFSGWFSRDTKRKTTRKTTIPDPQNVHLLKNMFYFPPLVLKGIYRYWTYVLVVHWAKERMAEKGHAHIFRPPNSIDRTSSQATSAGGR